MLNEKEGVLLLLKIKTIDIFGRNTLKYEDDKLEIFGVF